MTRRMTLSATVRALWPLGAGRRATSAELLTDLRPVAHDELGPAHPTPPFRLYFLQHQEAFTGPDAHTTAMGHQPPRLLDHVVPRLRRRSEADRQHLEVLSPKRRGGAGLRCQCTHPSRDGLRGL